MISDLENRLFETNRFYGQQKLVAANFTLGISRRKGALPRVKFWATRTPQTN